MQRSYDQILHDVARVNLPVVFCIDRAGVVDGDGDTHQGIFDVAFLSTIPGITILAPKNIEEAINAIDYTYMQNKPIAIRYPKYDYNDALLASNDFNSWDIIKTGKTCIISYGRMLHEVSLLINDLDIALVNAKNLSIIDENILNEFDKFIVIEDVISTCCLGEKIISYCYKNKINKKIITHNLGNTYLECGSYHELITKYIGDLEQIIKKGDCNAK